MIGRCEGKHGGRGHWQAGCRREGLLFVMAITNGWGSTDGLQLQRNSNRCAAMWPVHACHALPKQGSTSRTSSAVFTDTGSGSIAFADSCCCTDLWHTWLAGVGHACTRALCQSWWAPCAPGLLPGQQHSAQQHSSSGHGRGRQSPQAALVACHLRSKEP